MRGEFCKHCLAWRNIFWLELRPSAVMLCCIIFITAKTTSKKFNTNKILIAEMSGSLKITVKTFNHGIHAGFPICGFAVIVVVIYEAIN